MGFFFAFRTGVKCGYTKPMNKVGRPTSYTLELADKICDWIADGKSLREFCEQDDTPSRASVHNWLSKNKEFLDQYARAQIMGADANADDISFIGDLIMSGHLDPQAGKAAADCKKWAAEKKAPKKYGARIVHAGDDDSPITVVTRRFTDA